MPAERINDNEEWVRRLDGRLPPELHRRLAEAIVGRDVDWHTELQRILSGELYSASDGAVLPP